MATGFGLSLSRESANSNLSVRPYYLPASNSSVVGTGDVVKLLGGMDPLNEVPTIQLATIDGTGTGTEVLLGVVVGFEPLTNNPYNSGYRSASTGQYVLVCDDARAVYQVQEDAVGGSVSAANVGSLANANLIYAAASTTTGLSGTMLDSSSAVANTTGANVRIIGVKRDSQNAAAKAGGAVLEVQINNQLLK